MKSVNNVLSKLDKFLEKEITVTISGFINSSFKMYFDEYTLKKDILNITDKASYSYVRFNINQVYNVNILDSNIVIYLDNDLIIDIKL